MLLFLLLSNVVRLHTCCKRTYRARKSMRRLSCVYGGRHFAVFCVTCRRSFCTKKFEERKKKQQKKLSCLRDSLRNGSASPRFPLSFCCDPSFHCVHFATLAGGLVHALWRPPSKGVLVCRHPDLRLCCCTGRRRTKKTIRIVFSVSVRV